MSLQFIIGSSGSGKTYNLYKELIRMSMDCPDYNYIALVPEQATLQTQKEIVNMHPYHGVMNIDILSFERLAYRIFEELGCTPKLVLDDVGKNMLLRKAFARTEDRLGVYKKNLNKPGFIDEVKSLFSELYQYRIDNDILEKLVDNTGKRPLVNRKLKDILILKNAFEECMEPGTIAAEEVLEVLCRVMEQSNIIRNSVITLDGFTGFTPVQYEVIRNLLRLAKKVVITMTVDERENPYGGRDEHTLFYLSRKTIERLNKIAADENIAREEDIRIGGVPYRLKVTNSLAFLERELFRYPYKTSEDYEGIKIHAMDNPKGEIRFVAEEIFKLVREDKIRYREIGVVLSDVEAYSPFVREYFEQADIPYFIDDKKSLMGNPLVEFIRAVIEVIDRKFDYQSVFRYLKSGFLKEHDAAVYEMENYVIAFGIRGAKAWEEEWKKLYYGGDSLNLEWINKEKAVMLEPVLKLNEALTGEFTVDSAIKALHEWLYSQEADIILDSMADEFEAAGEYSLAREYRRAYKLVLDLFDRLIGLAPDEKVSLKELSDILDAGFEKIKVGMIPPCIDRVMVGDMTRSRLKDIKHLFVVGLNDCYLPKANEAGGILSELDRDIISELGIELAPGARESSFIERFYVYLMVTKPSKSLTLTLSKSNMSGKGLRPSSYINSILKLFNGLEVHTEDEKADEIRHIISRASAATVLTDGIREHSEAINNNLWKELYGWFKRDNGNDKLLEALIDNAFLNYSEESIGEKIAKALYGREITGSVTRLEQYAACAYAQFLTYGLRLSERKQYEFEAVDLGNVFHGAIERYFKYIKKNKLKLSELDEETRKAIVKQCVSEACEGRDDVLNSSARDRYMINRIERIADRTVWALGEQIRKGSFIPAGFEVPFGAENDAMLISLDDESEMKLKGRVDRIDYCENGDTILVKIMDYKSGSTSFDESLVYNGLQIQLVVYLDAVMQREKLINKNKNTRIAGVFYYNIQDPLVDSEGARIARQDADLDVLAKLKPNGLVNDDIGIVRLLDSELENKSDIIPVTLKDGEVNRAKSSVANDKEFELLIKHVKAKMTEFAKQMHSGNITAAPYKLGNATGCDYCSFKGICGFDRKLSGYKYRKLNKIEKEDLWVRLAEAQCETDNQ